MSRLKTYLIILLGLALAGTMLISWQQYQELQTLRIAAMGSDTQAALGARLAEANKRNYELQTQLVALRNAEANSSAAAEVVGPGPNKTQLAKSGAPAGGMNNADQFELLGVLADLPEFQKLLAVQQRGKVEAKYAALFKRLGLKPEELARLQNLLVEKLSAYADAMIAARQQGFDGKEAHDVAIAVANESQKGISNNIKGLLGPQRYLEFQNYERTQPQRELVNLLSERLSYTSTPLTLRQQEELVLTLAPSGPAAPANTAKLNPTQPIVPLNVVLSGLGIGSAPSAPITPAAISRARIFLSPQQVDALGHLQLEQHTQQTLNGVLSGKPAGSNPGPPLASQKKTGK